MSMTKTQITDDDDRKNLVLRLPPELLERIDNFKSERGGSRHSAILYLIDLGISGDAEIARRVEMVKTKLRGKLERDLAETKPDRDLVAAPAAA